MAVGLGDGDGDGGGGGAELVVGRQGRVLHSHVSRLEPTAVPEGGVCPVGVKAACSGPL